MVQSRISDSRAIQFWDKRRLVAQELKRELAAEPNGYHPKGVLWDFAALYGKQAQWGKSAPVFTGGPVVFAVSDLEKRLYAFSAAGAER
jgi:hypothetical protein